MKNAKVLFQEIVSAIALKEKRAEIEGIAFILLESIYGITRVDIMSGKLIPDTEGTAPALQKLIERINQGEPVQYVVGEEYFFGRKFQVNSCVLIPRPETEDLIREILLWSAHRNKSVEGLRILDVGTGSGCIPVTLFLEIANAEIYATDVSTAALSVALQNAESLQANITLIEHNILNEDLPVAALDIVVSNPPYVTENEKRQMKANVLNFEPHLALFVPDDDPLLFYREIAAKARGALKPYGLLAVEVNENFGREVAKLFLKEGFQDVKIVNDLAEKPRIVRGVKRSRS